MWWAPGLARLGDSNPFQTAGTSRADLLHAFRRQLLAFCAVPVSCVVVLLLTREGLSRARDLLTAGDEASRFAAGTAIVRFDGTLRTLVVSGIAALLLLALYTLLKEAPIRRHRQLRRLPRLPRGKTLDKLRRKVTELARSIGVQSPDLRLVRTRGSMPSVSEDSFGAILLIPSDFVILFADDEEGATAILAHELAHVVHRDAWIYYDARLFSGLFSFVIAPLMAIVLLVSVLSASYVMVSGFLVLFVWNEGRHLNRLLFLGRMSSEYRADGVACRFADGWALIRVINQHVSPARSRSHPPFEKRIESAEVLMIGRAVGTPVASSTAYELGDVLQRRAD